MIFTKKIGSWALCIYSDMNDGTNQRSFSHFMDPDREPVNRAKKKLNNKYVFLGL